MASERWINILGSRYRIKKLTRDQKYFVRKHHLNEEEWLFISENESYLRIVKKDTLETNPVVKNLNKYGRA